jgi:hypothetical protein
MNSRRPAAPPQLHDFSVLIFPHTPHDFWFGQLINSVKRDELYVMSAVGDQFFKNCTCVL